MNFKVQSISPSIGSIISGLNLSEPLAPHVLQELRKVWLQRKVLVFPKQSLTPQQQVDCTRQFGELDQYPFIEGIKGMPYVAEILKLPNEEINFGGVWHSDTSYLINPAAGASLYALEIPPIGGDTIFCNMGAAYQALTNDIKEKVNPLNAVNTSNKTAVSKTRAARLGKNIEPDVYTHSHPVIRTHPETGEKTIYVNEAHTLCFEGWSEKKSQPLLNLLYQHARKPEFQCRIKWQKNMFVLWDNRSTHHYPINDYTGYRRLLHRVSIKGDIPT